MNNPNLYAEIKQVKLSEESGDLVIKGYANTVAKDRAGDVIPAETWKTSSALTNYMKNPILLAFHNHTMPIGEVTALNITSEGLEVTARIPKSAPEHVYGLIKDQILKAFSVGFRILDADYNSDADIFVIKDLELHEISVVSVPCNQDSLFSLQKSLGSKDYQDLKKQFAPTKEPVFATETEKLLYWLNNRG